ncbi:uncharacterized protein LOC131940487 [Physella acuta]|uniref:uncharacterized protein LOC131940487 n=1 Tax=Physella acuta TaxID=109671 RepID=UPI0027DD6580|nr:uncharacterized protein LOC131940487 [Physella acuta]
MTFYDAKCSDAGVYICQATYADSVDGNIHSTYENQSVDTFIGLVPESVTLNPQNKLDKGPNGSVNSAGSDVNLTCTVTGPEYVTIKWKINNTYEVRGEYESVAINSTNKMCIKYRHWSTLRHQILRESSDNVYTIVCVATANLEETTVGTMTIYIKNESKANEPNTALKNLESHDIVSPGDVPEGESFTVTCDASRAGVPENETKISSLSIYKSTTMETPKTTYAKYETFRYPNTSVRYLKVNLF